MTTAAVSELRAHPREGDIRVDRPLSADSRILAERAAMIRALRRPLDELVFVEGGIHFSADFRRAA